MVYKKLGSRLHPFTDSTGRSWKADSIWMIKDQQCSKCQCKNGEIKCDKLSCDILDDCNYTKWAQWSACNSTCISYTSKSFRFRQPTSGARCSKTTETKSCDNLGLKGVVVANRDFHESRNFPNVNL